MRTLRETRKASKLTLEDLHLRTGITISTLSNIETGKHFPKPSTQQNLEQILGEQIDWLSMVGIKFTSSTNIEAQRAFKCFIQVLFNMEEKERIQLIKITRRLLTSLRC